MADENRLDWNAAGWDQVLTDVVDRWAKPKAEAIAAAANATLPDNRSDPLPAGKRDYMVSTEGSNPLDKGDYRATVITVTNRAKADNARNNTLIRNFGGA